MAELIVAGFHRSGTSLLTELFHQAGLFVGDDLLGAMPSNPYGHFEDRAVLRIHEEILRDNGMNWQADRVFVPFIDKTRWDAMQVLVDTRRVEHALWGFKDPRVCFFLPMWKQLLPEMRTVIVYRDPAQAISSLHRRQARDLTARQGSAESHERFWADPDLGLRMWVAHNRPLVGFANAYPDDTVVVSFSALARGFPVVEYCIERWDLPLEPIAASRVFDPAVTATTIEPLRVFDESLHAEARAVFEQLESLDASIH